MTTERQLPARSVLDTQSLVSKESAKLTALREKRSEEHTSELQSHSDLVCRLLLEKKKKKKGRKSNGGRGRRVKIERTKTKTKTVYRQACTTARPQKKTVECCISTREAAIV